MNLRCAKANYLSPFLLIFICPVQLPIVNKCQFYSSRCFDKHLGVVCYLYVFLGFVFCLLANVFILNSQFLLYLNLLTATSPQPLVWARTHNAVLPSAFLPLQAVASTVLYKCRVLSSLSMKDGHLLGLSIPLVSSTSLSLAYISLSLVFLPFQIHWAYSWPRIFVLGWFSIQNSLLLVTSVTSSLSVFQVSVQICPYHRVFPWAPY